MTQLIPPIKYWVLGFAFDDLGQVALIHKARPTIQRGKWNGIGGSIEGRELAVEAMVREFDEETGILLPKKAWTNVGRMYGPDWHCEVFTACDVKVNSVRSTTDEIVGVFNIRALPDKPSMMDNLPSLIALCEMHHRGLKDLPQFTLQYSFSHAPSAT